MTSAHTPLAVEDLTELAPLLRRAAALHPATLVRVRIEGATASAFVSLPFGGLAGRSVTIDAREQPPLDITSAAHDLVSWIEEPSGPRPSSRDAEWRAGLPPMAGWRRLDSVPDDVVRKLVAAGARTLQESAAREGVPGAQPRADVADALLDSIVLTVTAGSDQAHLSLRTVSSLTRMGFLPPGSSANVDIAGRWLRIAGRYGSVYSERPGAGLGLLL